MGTRPLARLLDLGLTSVGQERETLRQSNLEEVVLEKTEFARWPCRLSTGAVSASAARLLGSGFIIPLRPVGQGKKPWD